LTIQRESEREREREIPISEREENRSYSNSISRQEHGRRVHLPHHVTSGTSPTSNWFDLALNSAFMQDL